MHQFNLLKSAKLIFPLLLIGTLIILSFKEKEKDTYNSGFTYQGKMYKPGDTVYGYKGYIKLVVGDSDSPLLLGVPHDGKNAGNPEIPEIGTTGRDINTLPLAVKIAENFHRKTKKRAWMVINTISRKRVEPNTYPKDVEAKYADGEARKTYDSYHSLIRAAREYMAVIQKNGKGGLFLDLHGHAHKYVEAQPYTSVKGKTLSSRFIDQTELGYGLSNYAISQTDEYLNKIADSSSIAALAKAHPNVPFSQLIRGPYSFGALLEKEGVVAVPSDKIQVLESSEELFGTNAKGEARRRPYFNGGFCSRKYGTLVLGSTVGYNDNISSIQAETPGITVRNNAAIIEISSVRFNNAIINFLNKWYGYNY